MNPAAIDASWTIEQQGQFDAQFTAIELYAAIPQIGRARISWHVIGRATK